MATNIELYEATEATFGQEAARMLAESIPGAEDLATKADIHELRAANKADINEVRVETRELKADLTRWMLTFFVPLWLGTFATLVAVLVRR